MDILLWPHESLKIVCEPVDPADPDFRGQLEEMVKLAEAKLGIGLAANQVGLNKRMLVAKDPELGWQKFVNPVIFMTGGQERTVREGCLSIPGFYDSVPRHENVTISFHDAETGATVIQTFDGQLGHVLQHEIEHLDGKMFLSDFKLKSRMAKAKYKGKLK